MTIIIRYAQILLVLVLVLYCADLAARQLRITKTVRNGQDNEGSCTAICRRECDSYWSGIYGDLCFCSPCPSYGSAAHGTFPNPLNETCDTVCTRNNCYDETRFIKFGDGTCYCEGCPDPRGTPHEDRVTCKKLPKVLDCRNATDIDCSKYLPWYYPC